MVIKVKLKNADKYVLLDHEVFEALNALPQFKEYDIFEHLREHSSGVPVFQKYVDTIGGKLNVVTIYLALYIAKLYLPRPDNGKRMFLSFLNGDKLDLRLKNMKWEEMSTLSRQRRITHNKTGFRGVRATPQGKFVAMISDGTKQVYLGTFDSAEEAALEYNKKSIELFGHTSNLNQVDSNGRPIPFEVDEEKETHERKRKPRNKSLRAAPVEQFVLIPVHIESRRKNKRKEEVNHHEPVVENPPVAQLPEEHHEQDAVPVEVNSTGRNYNG
jgi:hypothetical protein